MAAVSDGGEKTLGASVDYDLQKHLKGLNTATPDLSTLAQKGDEKVRRKKQTRSYNEYLLKEFALSLCDADYSFFSLMHCVNIT